MKDLKTIIKYTIKENVTKKSFKIVTVVLILFIIAICNIPNIIKIFADNEQEELEKIILEDKNAVLGEEIEAIKQAAKTMGYDVEINPEYSEDEVNKRIENEEYLGRMIIKQDKKTGNIKLDYIVAGSFFSDYAEIEIFQSLIKSVQVNKELIEANVSPEALIRINSNIECEIKMLNDQNNNFGVALICSYILFFAIFFYGNTVANSIASEKSSRVMETLVTSTTPKNIIIGKTIAMGIVGIAQMAVLILTAVVSYNLFIPDDFTVVKMFIENINLNASSIFICAIYFILGYLLFAFTNAVCGATVSKIEDLSQAQTPVMLIAMVSFYLAYFTATVPDSPASKFASIFPFSSAFSMPGRILAGGASGVEIISSVIALFITTALLAFISIRVYQGAVLHYGKRLNIKELLKMSKEK